MHPALFLSFFLPLGALSIPSSNGRSLSLKDTELGAGPSGNDTSKGMHNVTGYAGHLSTWKYVNDGSQRGRHNHSAQLVSPMAFVSQSIYVEFAYLALDAANHVTFLSVFSDFSPGGPSRVSCNIAIPGIIPNNATSNTTILGTLPDAPSMLCNESLNHMGVNFTRSSGSGALDIFFLHTVQYENATHATVRSVKVSLPMAPLFSYENLTNGKSIMANGTQTIFANARSLSLLAETRMLRITEEPAPAGWQGDLAPCVNLTNTTPVSLSSVSPVVAISSLSSAGLVPSATPSPAAAA